MHLFKSTDGMSLIRNSDTKIVKVLLFLALLPSILSALVALFAPKNVLQLLPFFLPAVDLMNAQLQFMLDRVTVSSIPQVLALTYLICIGLLPIQMILLPYCYFKYVNTSLVFKRLSALGYKRWKMLLIAYCALPLLVFAITLNGNYHFLWIDPINTRTGLVIVAVFGFIGLNLVWIQCLALTFSNNLDCEEIGGQF